MSDKGEFAVTDLGLASYLSVRGHRIIALRDSTRGVRRDKKAFIFPGTARRDVSTYYADSPERRLMEEFRKLKSLALLGQTFEMTREEHGAPTEQS